MNVHGERAEHVAAKAIRMAVDALSEAEERLADDHAQARALLAAAASGIELARAALAEAGGTAADGAFAAADSTFLRELVKLILDVRFWASEGELQTVTGYYAIEYGRLLKTTIDLGDSRHAAMIFCAAGNVRGYPHKMRSEEIRARLGSGYEQRIDEVLRSPRSGMPSPPRRLNT